MSDTTKRDAVLEEFCPQRYRESPWQTIRKLAAEDMADEIARLRDENAALRAAVERVLALHVGKQAFYPHPDGSVRALPSRICETCNTPFPCRAFRALEGTP